MGAHLIQQLLTEQLEEHMDRHTYHSGCWKILKNAQLFHHAWDTDVHLRGMGKGSQEKALP